MRNNSALNPAKGLADSVRIKHEDGSEWLLLPNLELRLLKGPTKRGRKPKSQPSVEEGLF